MTQPENVGRSRRQQKSLEKATRVRSAKGHHRARESQGFIRADEILTLDGYAERMGTTRAQINESRRLRNLPCHWNGKQVLISGRELLEWVESLPVAELAARTRVDATESEACTASP